MHQRLLDLLREVAEGRVTAEDAVTALRDLPTEDLGFAQLDHHRVLRNGQPEVVYGEGKTAEQIAAIVARLKGRGTPVLVTRFDAETYARCAAELDADSPGRYDPVSRVWDWHDGPLPVTGRGTVAVVAAGTSDLPVAEEAARVSEVLGNRTERIVDVGVAGIHRLVSHLPTLHAATVTVVVAGMEGALPSVVAGLVACPVVAVPTSVGYGAHLGGLTPLMAMLTSCAAGVSVVNIDNGFGAACVASRINHAPPASADVPEPPTATTRSTRTPDATAPPPGHSSTATR